MGHQTSWRKGLTSSRRELPEYPSNYLVIAHVCMSLIISISLWMQSLVLAQSNNSRIENVNLLNGKGFNMKVYENENVTITNVHVTSPGDSPNTDGVHIGRIKNVQITDSVIGVGDDCVSIGDGSIDVTVRNVMCGPGHGIRSEIFPILF